VAVLLVKNLQLKCLRGVADLENGTALHSILYFSDDRPQAKKKTKKVGEEGAFKELGHLFSALQASSYLAVQASSASGSSVNLKLSSSLEELRSFRTAILSLYRSHLNQNSSLTPRRETS